MSVVGLVRATVLASLAWALWSPVAHAQTVARPSAPARPHLQAWRLDHPPVLDGRLDDAAWASAPVSDTFTEKFPREGQRPLERTSLRIAYDAEALYVAIDCEQRLAPVAVRLTRRDRMVESDWVSVAIDTRRDGKSGFDFNVNAAGVLTDSIRFDDTDVSTDWDENWDARTAITPAGWSAEIRIPLRILRFARVPVQSWGFQARRHVSHRQETDEWAFIPRSSAGEVSQYGRLDNLAGLDPGRGIELVPFVWERMRRRDERSGQVASGTDVGAAAGLDLKWHPSQQLTVDAAILPDFAQVEADQVLLNLSNLEIHFPEKRRFFLEGIDTFSTPEVQILYTRRIGRAAPDLALQPGERLVDVPAPADIYGALKVTGHVGDRWEVGALSALTARNLVDVQKADGTRERRLADPLTAFNVLRVKRALGDNGHLGLMATSVLHAQHSERDGAVGANDAHVASFDWRWASGSGDYVTTGQLMASRLDRGPPRLVPDGTRIDSGDVGGGVHAVLVKQGGAHWLWNVWGVYDGRKFDVNDLGYNDRANQAGAGGEIIFRTLQPWAHTLETTTKLQAWALDNLDGLPVARLVALGSNTRLANFWKLGVNLAGSPHRFDDREVGDGAALERAGVGELSFEAETDPRARIFARLTMGGQLLTQGRGFRAELGLLFKVLPALDLELDPSLLVARGEPRYAATTASGDYLFGELSARSAGTILRATYTVTPRLTLQTYAQLFLAARHYRNLATFTPAAAGQRPAIHLRDLQPGAATPDENPDTEEGAINANVVLRWEYRAGSLLYLVYTRAQAPEVTLAPGQVGRLDLRSVRRGPAADVVLLKLSFWWG